MRLLCIAWIWKKFVSQSCQCKSAWLSWLVFLHAELNICCHNLSAFRLATSFSQRGLGPKCSIRGKHPCFYCGLDWHFRKAFPPNSIRSSALWKPLYNTPSTWHNITCKIQILKFILQIKLCHVNCVWCKSFQIELVIFIFLDYNLVTILSPKFLVYAKLLTCFIVIPYS